MIEKIKISLWDFYTFILSGTLALVVTLIHMRELPSEINFVLESLKNFNVVFVITAIALIGMLLEPVANKFMDILSKEKVDDSPNELKEAVIKLYKENFGIEVTKPYHFIKDYCVQNDLCYSFMPFLSKFGFY
jgi:hypothetical protein